MNINGEVKRTKKQVFLAMIAVLMAFSIALMGCSSNEKTEETENQSPAQAESIELSIFAANSLEKAMPEVQALYAQNHENVSFSDAQFKASGDLVAQLEGGATADVLITASSATMDNAEKSDLIKVDSRVDMFANDLVVVRGEGSSVEITGLNDVESESINRIAIGDGALVPAGTYANQSLSSVGLYTSDTGKDGQYAPSIADKVALADKVGTAAQYVASGDCQIGFVYSSDVYRYNGIEVAYVTPSDSHKTILYPGAVCEKSAQAEAAQDFLDFCLNDPKAQAIWASYGFELV